MAGNRILCSCWSSGTFQVCNITLLPVVQLELCTLQCKPSTFYNNNEEKSNYTFISLFNKTCLVEDQDHKRQLPLYNQPYSPFWNYMNVSLILCYLFHIFPSSVYFVSPPSAIYFISSPRLFTLYLLSLFTSNHPPALYFTFHPMLFATAITPPPLLLFTQLLPSAYLPDVCVVSAIFLTFLILCYSL